MPVNSAYQPKPEPKQKAKRTRKAAKARTSTRSAAKLATTRNAKPKASKKPKKVRLTPGERKARAAGERRKLKVLGLCKDCRQHAIPGQTRCPDCAEKHRQSRRRQRQAQRQAKQISSLGVFERLVHPSNSIQAPKRNAELSSLRLRESGSAQEANAGVNSDSPIS